MAEVEAVRCECCGLEEECTGDYIGGVRAYFVGRWLCGLCSEAVKYEAGKCGAAAAGDVQEAVRAHMAICRTLKMSGGPAGRVAAGMRQMLRTATLKRSSSSSSSSSASSSSAPSPRTTTTEHHRASSSPLSVGI